jgi:hypothetical protein
MHAEAPTIHSVNLSPGWPDPREDTTSRGSLIMQPVSGHAGGGIIVHHRASVDQAAPRLSVTAIACSFS